MEHSDSLEKDLTHEDTTTSMKIGVNGRAFSVSEPGGAVQSATKITRKLGEQDTHDLTVYGHRSIEDDLSSVQFSDDGYFVHSQSYGLVWEQTVLPRIANKHGIDVLYCPNGNSPVYDVSVPTVVVIHDILNYLGYTSRPYQMLQRVKVPKVARAADRIITVSEFSKSEIIDNIGIEQSKIDVVPNGIDRIYLSDDSGDSVDIPDDYLLYVGGMHERKNVDGVLAAFLQLKDNEKMSGDLVLIGPEGKLSYESSDVSWSKVRQRSDIHTKGFVSQRELKYVYSNADVFVYPSRYEGFGLPPLEAMASGTPVVSSRCSAIPEVVDDAARLVDPDDTDAIAEAVKDLLQDEELRSEYIKRGEKRASEFTWERAANKTARILEDVAE